MRTLIVLALLLSAAPVRAAELQFTASVDQTTVGLGETFQLNLTVEGEGMVSAPRPVLPALPDFNVLGSSSSQSTSISFVNGQVKKQSSITFVYGLSAKKLGRLVIPPCKLTYEGKDYQSQPIEITVVKAAQGQAQPLPPQQPGVRAPGANVPIEGNVFLTATPSRRTVYAGEPVIVEVALGTRLRIADGGWADVPAFDGFWAEKVFDAARFEFQRRTIEGKAFDVAPLKTVALFPLAPGDVTIKPLAFNVAVVVPSRDPFGFFGSSQTVRVESKPVTIHVLPLPEKDKPKEFNGGVGRFTLAAALDRSATTNSEPINLTVRVSGSGNLRMIEKPALPAVPGLRILDPEIKDDIRAAADGVRGTKTFRYPVIPQADGRYVIPAFRMAYFDPDSKSYRTLQAGPFECSASGSVASAPLAEASGLKVLGSDIEYIKADARGLAVTPLDPPAWPNLLYGVSLALLGGALWYRGHAQRLLSDRGYARKVRSSGLARKRLRRAESLLGRKDERGFHAALSAAVVGYAGDRFNIDTQAMTKDQLRGELEAQRVAPETVDELLSILACCETAQFSPQRAGGDDAQQLLRKTREALSRL